MCAARRKLAAFGDKSVVPDQILSSELGSFVAAHVRVGCRTGPITLQRSKSFPHALIWLRTSELNIQGDTGVG